MLRTVFTTLALGSFFVCWGSVSTSAQEKETQKTDSPAGTTAPAAPQPRRDRWLVKTASDPDAFKIKRTAQLTTIEKLLAMPRPKELPLDGSNDAYQARRTAPVEMTVYSVEADVVECQLMRDGDYRVTLKGASGKTLILEMPDPAPEFVSSDSPFAYAIKAAREQFNSRAKPEKTPTLLHAHARITGIGYFARAFGKQKPEGNLVQLHPVLLIDWMEKPSKEFAQAAEKEQSRAPAEAKKP